MILVPIRLPIYALHIEPQKNDSANSQMVSEVDRTRTAIPVPAHLPILRAERRGGLPLIPVDPLEPTVTRSASTDQPTKPAEVFLVPLEPVPIPEPDDVHPRPRLVLNRVGQTLRPLRGVFHGIAVGVVHRNDLPLVDLRKIDRGQGRTASKNEGDLTLPQALGKRIGFFRRHR